MTTHETQPETFETASPDTMETTGRHDRAADLDAPFEQPPQQSASAGTETAAPATNLDAPDTGQVLFGDSELSSMRSRWADVQATFVDDPRDCVQKADGLVADVVDKLTSGFAAARSHLEEQWARGEEVSTEDLRVALKRYREFFERLLAV